MTSTINHSALALNLPLLPLDDFVLPWPQSMHASINHIEDSLKMFAKCLVAEKMVSIKLAPFSYSKHQFSGIVSESRHDHWKPNQKSILRHCNEADDCYCCIFRLKHLIKWVRRLRHKLIKQKYQLNRIEEKASCVSPYMDVLQRMAHHREWKRRQRTQKNWLRWIDMAVLRCTA